MKIRVEFTSRAFVALEALPQHIAFGIVTLTEYLRTNPEMGRIVRVRRAPMGQYRLLIYRGTHRIIYEYDVDENCAYIDAVQDCRQRLPDARVLKRDEITDRELPLE
jgi:hypothetical protein